MQCLLFMGCQPDDLTESPSAIPATESPDADFTSSSDSTSTTPSTISLEGFETCELYPEYDPVMAFGNVVPPLGWADAYQGELQRTNFSFENVFCGEEYSQKRTLILVIGAGWCEACARLVELNIAPIAFELTRELDAEVVYLEIQDGNWQPADNEYANRHLSALIEDGVGWRVGDADTLIRDNGEMVTAPRFIARQPNLGVLPEVWVIRKRDMRVIASRDLAWMSRPGELPLRMIASDPEQDWSQPPLPPFRNQCEDGDDEETDTQTNDVADDAMALTLGELSGGICTASPDFYALEVDGPWRLQLTHDIRQGDLDLLLWDRETNSAAVNENGEVIGSQTAENTETLIGDGPGIVQVLGFGGSSARYTLTLEPFDASVSD